MPIVDIQIREKRFWRLVRPKTFCKRVIETAWMGNPDAEISVVLADDKFIHALNKQYRGKDKPTNVLSFENEGICAGDIVVAYGVLVHEAREQHKSFRAHLAHLLVHGTLHLQKYDHLTEKQALKMERLETKIMQKLGYPNPYKEDKC